MFSLSGTLRFSITSHVGEVVDYLRYSPKNHRAGEVYSNRLETKMTTGLYRLALDINDLTGKQGT